MELGFALSDFTRRLVSWPIPQPSRSSAVSIELDRIRAATERAAAAAGSTLLLAGEEGIGKSRLAAGGPGPRAPARVSDAQGNRVRAAHRPRLRAGPRGDRPVPGRPACGPTSVDWCADCPTSVGSSAICRFLRQSRWEIRPWSVRGCSRQSPGWWNGWQPIVRSRS